MWPTKKNQDVDEWARRLEAGEEGDPTLELAAMLSKHQPEIPPAGEFKAELWLELMAQNQRRSYSWLGSLNGYAGSIAAVGLLAVVVLATWLSISRFSRETPGQETRASEIGALPTQVAAIENRPLVVESPSIRENDLSSGEYAPDFTLVDAKSGRHIRLSQFKGQPVLLNFWATWCVPCRAEMPHIEKAYREQGPQGLVVLAVNFDESQKDVLAYGQELGLSFPLLLDPSGKMQQKEYDIYQYPTTLFIAPDGTIRVTYMGPLTEKMLADNLGKIQS